MDEITTAHPTSHSEDHPVPTNAQVEPQDLSAKPTTRPKKTVSKASTAVASPSLSKTSTLRNENARLPCKTSSTIHETLPSLIVPKFERRGLLSNIALVAERRNAKEYTRRTKWFITFIVAAGAAIVTTVRLSA